MCKLKRTLSAYYYYSTCFDCATEHIIILPFFDFVLEAGRLVLGVATPPPPPSMFHVFTHMGHYLASKGNLTGHRKILSHTMYYVCRHDYSFWVKIRPKKVGREAGGGSYRIL